MRSKVRAVVLIVTILLALAAAAWAVLCIPQLMERQQEAAQYEDLLQECVAVSSEDSPSSEEIAADRPGVSSEAAPAGAGPQDIQVDFAALTTQNADTVAWLYLPGAGINYPVVQAADNDAYLRRSFTGEQSIAGTPFLDFANSADFSDGNSIVYGHNMFDGSTTMFSSLPRYTDAEFWQENPDIRLLTPDGGEKVYRIFAVCQFDVTQSGAAADYYRQDFRSAEHQAEYIQTLQSRSVIQTGETVPAGSTLLTLSTCDRSLYGGNGRLVVIGYLAG